MGTGAVTATLLPSASILYGVYASSAEAANACFIKFYWEGTGVAPPTTPFGSQPAVVVPAAGTSVPQLTIAVPQTGTLLSAAVPLNNGGRIWYWISKNPALLDTTVLVTGGGIVTFIYD
jgi:hypothetical protein